VAGRPVAAAAVVVVVEEEVVVAVALLPAVMALVAAVVAVAASILVPIKATLASSKMEHHLRWTTHSDLLSALSRQTIRRKNRGIMRKAKDTARKTLTRCRRNPGGIPFTITTSRTTSHRRRRSWVRPNRARPRVRMHRLPAHRLPAHRLPARRHRVRRHPARRGLQVRRSCRPRPSIRSARQACSRS
jgi:hypothetical protein